MTLEEALARIDELEEENRLLEEENQGLRTEIEHYHKKNPAGRKKHDAAWMKTYHEFAARFESGMSIADIVAEGKISRRTAYRYKAYYDQLMRKAEKDKKEEKAEQEEKDG